MLRPLFPLPSLLCPACGELDTPRLARGSGPHVAAAHCAYCGRFIKWLPKHLFQAEALPCDAGALWDPAEAPQA